MERSQLILDPASSSTNPLDALTATDEPLRFDANGDYLRWEMQRLKEQVDAYIEASEGSGQALSIPSYHTLAAALLESRRWAVQARQEAVASGVSIPFDDLSRRHRLELAEETLLLLCMTQHLSAPVWKRVLYAQGDPARPYLEAGFASQLIGYGDHLLNDTCLLEPNTNLVRNGLLVLEQADKALYVQTGFLAQAVHTPHYVAAATLGRTVLDERLTSFCALREPKVELYDMVLDKKTRSAVDELIQGFLRRTRQSNLDERPWSLLLTGPRMVGKTMLAEAIASAFKRPLFVVELPLLPSMERPTDLLHLAAHNAQMLGAVLVLSHPGRLLAERARLFGTLAHLFHDYRGLIILEANDAETLDASLEPLFQFSIELSVPDRSARLQLWESHLPQGCPLAEGLDLETTAAAFELSGGQIKGALDWACQRAYMRGAPLNQEDIDIGAQTQLRSHLQKYADSSRMSLNLADLVLPEDSLAEVEELLAACRHRQKVLGHWGFGERLVTGHGIVALFCGEAGTGKTLCAEILANELKLNLSIISIPKIVSKWVGETEKNIRKLFAHARAENAMLLFDEADSLFAKRVSVERAQDHYQNMEVNNLLHEIERFDGIVILTTNLETNMDRAFERRILFRIEFPEPEVEERERIWKLLIPRSTPLDAPIDFEFLADSFELNGGHIKNAIVRAAYHCCARGQGLSEVALFEAAHQQAKAAGLLTQSLEQVRVRWLEKKSGVRRPALDDASELASFPEEQN